MLRKIYRWLFRRCADCGAKLDKKEYNRGDVCSKCFEDFNGLTAEQLTINEHLNNF